MCTETLQTCLAQGMWLRGMVGNCGAAALAACVKMIRFLRCAWMKEQVPGHPICK